MHMHCGPQLSRTYSEQGDRRVIYRTQYNSMMLLLCDCLTHCCYMWRAASTTNCDPTLSSLSLGFFSFRLVLTGSRMGWGRGITGAWELKASKVTWASRQSHSTTGPPRACASYKPCVESPSPSASCVCRCLCDARCERCIDIFPTWV